MYKRSEKRCKNKQSSVHWLPKTFYFTISESLVQLEELMSWKQQQKKSLISSKWCNHIYCTAFFLFEMYLLQIRNHVYREEQSRCSEQERMKTEISDLTEELHQKEITIATIMEKASLLERQLKMELETKHKLLTKQQVCK